MTDGLDGLAAGSALMGFGAFALIGYWLFRNPDVYDRRGQPARHGRVRRSVRRWLPRLPLVERRARSHLHGRRRQRSPSARRWPSSRSPRTRHLLIILICGINVMEAGSVAIQMGVFKASGRTKRLFRMSPIHHHFELIGWPETTVIIRFWLIAGHLGRNGRRHLHRRLHQRRRRPLS